MKDLTMYLTKPFIQEIRAAVNEPAAFMLYKHSEVK